MAAKRTKTPRKSGAKGGSTRNSKNRAVGSGGKAAGRTSAKATVSGPTAKGDAGIADLATAKMAGQEKIAGAFPFNAAKPAEFGRAALDPVPGQAVVPPHPIVGSRTLSESNG